MPLYGGAMRSAILSILLIPLLLLPAPVDAQTRDVPYWASMRAEEVNMRVGPSQDYPIEWVYKRQGLPVKVIRVQEGWRLISDPDGDQGWIVARLLSPERGALVVGEGLAAIRAAPSEDAPLKWNAQAGVVGALGKCEAGWCEIDVQGRKGWIREDRLWGAGEP
jgi:SH3-like domain-containing protein